MRVKPWLSQVLANDALTRGLNDPEARMLVEWLVEQAETLAEPDSGAGEEGDFAGLCRRARAIGRFVSLWSRPRERGAAVQLAAVERFVWPLPTSAEDPFELMRFILDWETRLLAAA